MKAAERSKRFYTDLRRHLKEIVPGLGGWNGVGDLVGIKGNTLLSFALGRSKGLTEETLAALDHHGMLPEITESDEDREPMAEWTGATKTTRQATTEKGYTGATLRKMCKDGRLDYQMTESGRYQIIVNDKYAALPITAMAALRARVKELEAENATLREQVEDMQMRFAFDGPSAPDSDANLVAVAETTDEITDEGQVATMRQPIPDHDYRRINGELGTTAPHGVFQES